MALSTVIIIVLQTLTVLYGLFRYKKLSRGYRFLLLLISLGVITNVVANILTRTIQNSFPAFHFYAITALIVYFLIYVKIQRMTKIKFILMLGLTVLFLGLSIYNSIVYQNLLEFPSHNIMLQSFQVIIFALIIYLNMLQNMIQTSIFKQPVFWLNTGSFIFCCITFSIFALYNFYYKSAPKQTWGHSLIYWANFFLYFSYLIAVILDSNQTNERHSLR